MESSLDLLFRRSALAQAGAVPDVHQQLEWADACAAAGLRESARLLFETAFLRQGFSPQHRAAQAQIAEQSGLWDPQAPVDDAAAPASAGTVELAIAELKRFAALAGRQRRAGGPPADGAQPSVAEPIADVADLAGQLYGFLRGPMPDTATADALTGRLASLATLRHRSAALDYRSFATAPLPLLATAMGVASLQEFTLRQHDLLFGPIASAGALHAAASFDNAGLGPYFTNVARIARRSRDIFELALIAVRAEADEAGEASAPTLHDWIILLSQHVSGHLRNEIIDDLGDLDATDVLGAILDRAARWPKAMIDVPLVMRLRDTALDNGDHDLAARAQTLIVGISGASLLERIILGSIQATGGMIAAAEETFVDALLIAPEDPAVTERLVALRARRFEPYAIQEGYGTPFDRKLERQRRRVGTRPVRRVETSRPVAVEL